MTRYKLAHSAVMVTVIVVIAALCFFNSPGTSSCYTTDGEVSPRTILKWIFVPKVSTRFYLHVYRNPNKNSEIKFGALLFARHFIPTPEGPKLIIQVVKYCYLKNSEIHSFRLTPGNHYKREWLPDKLIKLLKDLFYRADNKRPV